MPRWMGRFGCLCLLAVFVTACSSSPEELVAKHTRRGDEYVQNGKFPEAVIEYKNAVKSTLASRWGKLDEAISQLRKAVEFDSQNARPILTVGNLYLLKRDPKTAKEWFDRALAVDPDSVGGHVTRGNFFFASGNKDEGEKEYRRAIELSKEKEDLRIGLAQHYLFQGRMEESEKELNGVIQEMKSQKARKVLAEMKLDTGRTEEAKPEVETILRENENDPDGKYLKGRIALAEKRLDDAKAMFGEVIKLAPSISPAP